MRLNTLEFILMNNPIRASIQHLVEAPILLGPPDSLIGQRVLEIGCGRGTGIELLLRRGAIHVTAFDLDPAMVALAQRRAAKHGQRAAVFVGDTEQIPLPSASMHAVVEFGILHHVPHWQHALTEIARVLKPGGVFYFEDLFKGFISTWPMPLLFDHPQATQFTAHEFYAALESAGLHIRHWKKINGWGAFGQAMRQTEW